MAPVSSNLNALDEIKHRLEEQFPGWQVWYVPGHDRTVMWCARPWPLINTLTPEFLAAEIRQAHTEAAAEWPALASIPDYAVGAPGVRQPEGR